MTWKYSKQNHSKNELISRGLPLLEAEKQQQSCSCLNENSHQRLTCLINTWFPLGGGMVLGDRFNDFKIMLFPCCSHVNPIPFPLITLCLVVVEQDESFQLLFPAPAPCLPAYLPACLLPCAPPSWICILYFWMWAFPHKHFLLFKKKSKLKNSKNIIQSGRKFIHSVLFLSFSLLHLNYVITCEWVMIS